MDFNEFLRWELATNDTIDFKKIYVDVAGDLNAGLVLSEMVYWYLPSKDGGTKLRVEKAGTYWIAVRRYHWWERTRMSPKQADRALGLLEKAGLIEKGKFKFGGEPTVHVRIREENFLPKIKQLIDKPLQNPFFPKREEPISLKGEMDIPNNGTIDLPIGETPYTETATEIPALISQQGNKVASGELNEPAETTSGTKGKSLESNTNYDVDRAIREAWQTDAPGLINNLRKTLLGLHRDGDQHYSCNIKPPATPEEIRELGDFYRHRNPGIKMVTTPHKLQDWLYQVRKLRNAVVVSWGLYIPLLVKVPPDIDTPQKALNYVHNYYFDDETERLNAIIELMNNAVYQKKSQTYFHHEEGSITFQVPIPNELTSWRDVFKYLQENQPQEIERLSRERASIGGIKVGTMVCFTKGTDSSIRYWFP